MTTVSDHSDPLARPKDRRPQRITITVSWATHRYLLERSQDEGRSLSNLAAHLLEQSRDRAGN